MMNYYALIPLLAFLINGFMWTYIYALNRKSRVNRAYLIFAGFVEFGLLLEFFTWQHIETIWSIPLIRIESLSWSCVVFLFLNAIYAFLDKKADGLYKFFFSVTIVVLILNLTTDLILVGFEKHSWGVISIRGPLYNFIAVVNGVFPAFYSFFLLYREIKKNNEKRASLLLLLLGSIATFFIAWLTDILLPMILNIRDIVHLAAMSNVIFSGFVFMAVRKYGFLSIGVEEVAHDLFTNVRDGIVILDNRGNIIQSNRVAEAMVIIDNTRPFSEQVFKGYSFQNRYTGYEFDIETPDGVKTVSFSQTSIRRYNNSVGKLIVLRDITERKKMLRELKLSHADLEQRVDERTLELRKSEKRYRQMTQLLLTVQDEERQRLSRDIHDSMGEYLTTLLIRCGLLRKKEGKDYPRLEKELNEMDDLINEAIDECHRLSFELSPPSITKLGLVQALQEVIDGFAERTGIAVEFKESLNGKRLTNEQELMLFRILQEALNNIYKHASSKTVKVNLSQENGQIYLMIADEGKGFNVDHILKHELDPHDSLKGFGLMSMQERAANLNGNFEINSKVGEGTKIIVKIPQQIA